MKPVIHKNVVLGKNCIIDDDVEIGRFTQNAIENKTEIGNNAVLRKGTIVYTGVKIGNNFQSGHFTLIRENNQIGNNVSIGSKTELGPRNKIGDNTRVHSGCFLEDTVLEKNVFVAPNVTFTNDPHPRSTQDKDCLKGAYVDKEAIIGGGVTILPHIKIGKRAFIGAGSVVTKDVAEKTVVAGNPAKKIKETKDMLCDKNGTPHFPYEKNSFS